MKKSITVLFTALTLIGAGSISNIQNASATNIATTNSYLNYTDEKLTSRKNIATVSSNDAIVYNFSDQKHTMISANKAFERNSKWQTDVKRTMTNGTVWYRVSTNEWLKADNVTISNSNNTTPPSNGGNTNNSQVSTEGVKQAFINKLGLSQRGIKVGRPAGELETHDTIIGTTYVVHGTDGKDYNGLSQNVWATSNHWTTNEEVADQLMKAFQPALRDRSDMKYVEFDVQITNQGGGNQKANVDLIWWH